MLVDLRGVHTTASEWTPRNRALHCRSATVSAYRLRLRLAVALPSLPAAMDPPQDHSILSKAALRDISFHPSRDGTRSSRAAPGNLPYSSPNQIRGCSLDHSSGTLRESYP